MPLRAADYVAADALLETNATLTGSESAIGLFRRTGLSVSERTTGLRGVTTLTKAVWAVL